MHRHKHLFEQVCSFNNLHAAARKALRGKRRRLPGAKIRLGDPLPSGKRVRQLQTVILQSIQPGSAGTFAPVMQPWKMLKSF